MARRASRIRNRNGGLSMPQEARRTGRRGSILVPARRHDCVQAIRNELYLLSTRSRLVTVKTPGTALARMYANSLSA